MIRYLSAIFFILLWGTTLFASENDSGHISGAWIPRTIGPISGGLIYAFNANSGHPPERERTRRLPDAVAVTNEEGQFSLELAEGSYYLTTRKRVDGDAPGPPQDGDLYGLSRDEKGEPIQYTVKRGITNDIGILRQASVFNSHDTSKHAAKRDTGAITAISGVLTTPDGSPLVDAVAQVYADQNVKGRPLYVSQKSGKDGKYLIQLDQEGTYFVIVRAGYGGGRPQAGDMLGMYGGESAQPVTVKKLDIAKGINIQVGQFIDKRHE